jgi:lycopene cyclase domain-containing protein
MERAMATYLILNCVFIIALVLFLRIPMSVPGKKRLVVLGILLTLTLVFDSLLVGVGIVGYDTSKILGIYAGHAPIEDFFYSVLAVILIPFLWKQLERKK